MVLSTYDLVRSVVLNEIVGSRGSVVTLCSAKVCKRLAKRGNSVNPKIVAAMIPVVLQELKEKGVIVDYSVVTVRGVRKYLVYRRRGVR